MKYELALVLKPLNNEDIKERIIPKIEKTLKELNGVMSLKSTLGKRLLAYPISKFKEGIYFFYHIDVSSAKVNEFKKSLDLTNEILRFLLVNESKL